MLFTPIRSSSTFPDGGQQELLSYCELLKSGSSTFPDGGQQEQKTRPKS